MQSGIKEIKAGSGDQSKTVQSVILKDGTEIKADLVIIGIGVTPNTQFLKDSNVELDNDGGVKCNPFL